MITVISFLLLLVSSISIKGYLSESCVNTWDADLSIIQNLRLCPIQTSNGQNCLSPFNYLGTNYYTCTIYGPNNPENLPQCMTSNNQWAFCIVPTTAIVTGVATRKGSYYVYGSLNGGTLLWISGKRFAENLFSFSPTSATSNQVFLTNALSSYVCEIHPDKVTSVQITCYTPPLSSGRYDIRVVVNGAVVPLYQYTNPSNTYFYAYSYYTPTISSIVPTSGPPGSFVTINGDFKTSCYTKDIDGCSDLNNPIITRIYFGGHYCNLIDPTTSQLYKVNSQYQLYCKLENSEVGFFNATVLVSQEYGRSLAASSIFYVTSGEKIYNYLSYAEITSISTNSGSLLGGSVLTIEGTYFYSDNELPAVIQVGGKTCKLINFEQLDDVNTILTCQVPDSEAKSDFFGNRGITLIEEDVYWGNIESAQPTANARTSYINKFSYFVPNYKSITAWLKGYLVPEKSSYYELEFSSNVQSAVLYLSQNSSSNNKEQIAKLWHKNKASLYLNANSIYYIEAIISTNNGQFYFDLNGKMLNTNLTEGISSNIQNEKQSIEINSDIVWESYNVDYSNFTTQNGTSEIQQITLFNFSSYDSSVFVLSFDGAYTTFLSSMSNPIEIQQALNDLPTLYPDLISDVNITVSENNDTVYLITFSADLGDVPAIELQSGMNLTYDNMELVKGIPTGNRFQLIIEDAPTGLINPNDDATNIQNVIDKSFDVRCPGSLLNSNDVIASNEFEGECYWGDSSKAFCGKCARRSSAYLFYANVNSPLTYSFMCFAYKITRKLTSLAIQVSDLFGNRTYIQINIETTNDNNWHYMCVDLADAIQQNVRVSLRNLRLYDAYVYPADGDTYLDTVSIRKNLPYGYEDGTLADRRLQPKIQLKQLSVQKSTQSFSFSFKPANCGSYYKLAIIRQKFSNSSINMTRTAEASPPVTGGFDLNWNGQTISNIPANTSDISMKNYLQSFNGIGSLKVARSKDCAGYKWDINWLSGGDKNPFNVSSNNLSGYSPRITVTNVQDGGVFFKPIQDDMLRTYHTVPQVTVIINNVPSKCTNSCNFRWLEESTPVVSDIDTSNRNSIVLTGSGFDLNTTNNLVKLGDIDCEVTTSTTTQLICVPGLNPVGSYNFSVNVVGKGLAFINSTIRSLDFPLEAHSISPNVSGIGGGVLLSINGMGFSDSVIVKIDDLPCEIKTVNYSYITCLSPQNDINEDKFVDVYVTDGILSSNISQMFYYDFNNTSIVDGVSPNILSVLGDETITIFGSNFPNDIKTVMFDYENVEIVASNETMIILKSPALSPGVYKLSILTGALGYAKVNTTIEYRFHISSFSPRKGSIRGGTKLNIYGEGFNSNCSQNTVTLGEIRCEIDSCSYNSIVCTTKDVFEIYDIDNSGIDPVYGKGYKWSEPYLVVKVGDYVRWKWSAPDLVTGLSFKIEQVQDAASMTPIGFSSGEPTSSGTFTYQFMESGMYHYWSGYINNQQISFRGVVKVENDNNKEFRLDITQNGYIAQKCIFPFEYNGISYNNCTDVDFGYSWCSPTKLFAGQALKCVTPENRTECDSRELDLSACDLGFSSDDSFMYTLCNVPQITSISPLEITYDTLITIQGVNFPVNECENEIKIGKTATCKIISNSDTNITCKIGRNSSLIPNKLYPIELVVKNKGYALPNAVYHVKFIPVIISITPNQGSIAGNTVIQINGDGFSNSLTSIILDSLNFTRYFNISISYSLIEIHTPAYANGTYELMVYVNNILALCNSSCNYTFTPDNSPIVESVIPNYVNDSDTVLMIFGKSFGNDSSKVKVYIGSAQCEVLTVDFENITCKISYLELGNQLVSVILDGIGKSLDSAVFVTGLPYIKSIGPLFGSLNGGTLLEIRGNGFNSNSTVKLNTSVCNVVEASLGKLKCLTSAHDEELTTIEIKTNQYSYDTDNMDFSYELSYTPTISSIYPTSGFEGYLNITGFNFLNNSINTTDAAIVKIGKANCAILSISDTDIQCQLEKHSAGSFEVQVLVNNLGFSNKNMSFTYELNILETSSSEGSVYGGSSLIINGTGFSSNSSVKICNNECKIVHSDLSSITCLTPSVGQNQDTNCSLVITENGLSAQTSFAYKASLTPVVTSVDVKRGGTGGGTKIKINCTGIPENSTVQVFIAGSECTNVQTIVDGLNSLVQCETGSYAYSSTRALIQVNVKDIGLANNSDVYFEYIDLWSSKWTWGGESVPQEGEIAVIGPSQIVYFDAQTPILKGLIIQGGSLIFDDNQDVHLQAEYIIVTDNGLLQIGKENKPFTHKAVITMYGSVRSIELPIFGSKVLALRNGTIDMHGKPVGVTWTHLGVTANAGDTTITLKEPVNDWPIGGEIIIATTGNKFSPGQSELRKIKAINDATITIDSPLKFEHLAIKRTFNQTDIYIRAEVGLLSRNVVFQGNNDDSWNDLYTADACPDGFDPGEFAVMTCFLGRYGAEIGTDQFGATIMLSSPAAASKTTETVFLKMSNVELFHVGQAFRLGRYAIHFHMLGNAASSYIKECSIHQSFNRAVNTHATNYVTIESNVIYDIMGGAYFLEDGIEIGNVFKNNLAIFVKTSSSLLNEDVTPAAFWITNPNNTVIGNAVAGGTHFGYWYRLNDAPDGPSSSIYYCPKKIPLGRFYNNSVHSVGRFGLWIFPGYTPTVSGSCWDSTPSVAKFEYLTSYLNDKGAEFVRSNNVQFRNFVVYDHFSEGITTKSLASMPMSAYQTTYDESICPLVSDSIIIGNSDSDASSSITPSGLVVVWNRGLFIKSNTFYNFPTGQAMLPTTIIGECTFGCGGFTVKSSNLSFYNVNIRTLHRWDWDWILEDLDGSLNGNKGDVIVSNNNITLNNPKCKAADRYSNALVCSNTSSWIRFSFSQLSLSGVVMTNLTDRNNQTATSMKLLHRLTHPNGFMFAVEANQEYLFDFDQSPHPTNLSYSGIFYSILPGDYLIVKHSMNKRLDQFSLGFSTQQSNTTLNASSNLGDWYWDSTTRTISYMIRNSGYSPMQDIQVSYSAVKCRYANCIVPVYVPPVSPALRVPVTSRSKDALFLSNSSTWQLIWEFAYNKTNQTNQTASSRLFTDRETFPLDYDNVTIPDGVYIVVDTVLPRFQFLIIEGILELDNNFNHTLECDLLFINGGQLIIGWENDPIETNVEIIINGKKDDLELTLPDEIGFFGYKAIGVYGGLDLHGKTRTVTWTSLATSVPAGQNVIFLTDSVDWESGEQIILTTTSYSLSQTEIFTIASVDATGKQITLNSTLAYDHLGFSESFSNRASYNVAAAVGLLTRNIKLIGADYIKQGSELFGFRMIVSDYSSSAAYYKGYARLSNVEFQRFGQFNHDSGDDSTYGVLFSNLGEYNAKRPSYVKSCVFNYGYSAAIGAFITAGVPIENNLFYRTIEYGLDIKGHSNILRNNLVVSNNWAGRFLPWEANYLKTYKGAIDVSESESIVLENNFVVGCDRIGIYFGGDYCPGETVGAGKVHSIKNNKVYAAVAGGVVVFPDSMTVSKTCIKVSGFTVFRSSHYGIYFQNSAALVADSNILIDNQISFFSFITGPSSLTHQLSSKTVLVKDSLIVGRSAQFNCSTDLKLNDINFRSALTPASFGAGADLRGYIGLVWANFLSGGNGAPQKPWSNIMSYNALAGLLVGQNLTFVNFRNSCATRDYMLATNMNNDDGQHPVEFSNIFLYNSDNSSKIFIHKPNAGKINPSDCVDMDCDGLKNVLFTDKDGTFLGTSGTVNSKSDFGWGSQQRGLGDWRIPKEALADKDGHRLNISDVYKYTGTIRDDSLCQYQPDINGYQCHGLNMQILVIESMDSDTESRRLSPVAIFSDDNKYVTLLNGPQDHGWCFGYTCQKRISTFLAIVAANKNYDIFVTSTPPKRLRFRVINADSTFKIRLSMYYFTSNRIDLYKNSNFIAPTNAFYDNSGNMVLQDPKSNLTYYKPTYMSASGSNLYVKSDRKLYFSLTAPDYIDLVTTNVLFVRFGVPAITEEQFFEPSTLVANFAALLDVDPSKIRIVSIVRASRRKRAANGASAESQITFNIYNNPVTLLTDQTKQNESDSYIQKLEAVIINKYATGQLQEDAKTKLNFSLGVFFVQKNSSSNSSEGVEIKKLKNIHVVQDAYNCSAQTPCSVQPILQILDENNNTVQFLDNALYPWIVVAKLNFKSDPAAELLFQTEAYVNPNGTVMFEKLGVSLPMTNFTLEYYLKEPIGVNSSKFNPMNIVTDLMNSSDPSLTCKVNEVDLVVNENSVFSLTVSIVDQVSLLPLQNITWKNLTWTASLALLPLSKCKSNGTLTSVSSNATFDESKGTATFNNLKIDIRGMYLIVVDVRTVNTNQYNFDCISTPIVVKKSSQSLKSTENDAPNIYLTFNGNFSSNKQKLKHFESMLYNCILVKHDLNLDRSITLYEGSIKAVMSSSGTAQSFANLVADLANFTLDTDVILVSGTILDQNYNFTSRDFSDPSPINNVTINPSPITISDNDGNNVATKANEIEKKNSVSIGLIVGLCIGSFLVVMIPVSIFIIYKVYNKKGLKEKLVHPSFSDGIVRRKHDNVPSSLMSHIKRSKYRERIYQD